MSAGAGSGSGSGSGAGAGAGAGAREARCAALEAQEQEYRCASKALEKTMQSVEATHDTAFTTLAQLKGQLEVLQLANHGEQSAEAKALASKIANAKVACDKAAAKLKRYENAIERNYEQLKRVQSEIDAMRASAQATRQASGTVSPHVVPQRHLTDGNAAASAGAAIPTPIRIEAENFHLATALAQLSSMDSEQLAKAFPFEAGKTWKVGPIHILIRNHFPALFCSMCGKANVQNMGVAEAQGGHALLRGTAGTGKTYFMLVMFIQFLKMMRAASTVRKAAFTGAVTSIRIKWDQLNGGADILFDASPDQSMDSPMEYTRLHRVHLYDAGETLVKLPSAQGDGFYLATASADPKHYSAWDSKALVAKQYSVLWSPSELLLVGKWHGIAKDELADRFAVVGGVPRLVLSKETSELQAMVKQRLAGVTMAQVRTIIDSPRRDKNSPEDMLRGVDGDRAFSLFALTVEPEGDFNRVQVKFLTKYVATEFFKQGGERTVTAVLGELRVAIEAGSGLAGDTFEAWSVYELSKYGIAGEMTVLSSNGHSTVAQVDVAPCDTIRYFVDADHLTTLVERHGASAMYLPVAANNPLVDAWCVGTITCGDNAPEVVVIGCQMTVARISHPTTGEDEAKAQFQAIRSTLPGASHSPLVVSKSPWVLWVLPAQHYRDFPFQLAKDGEVPGTVWPFRQGKIGMLLSPEGRTPKNMESYEAMLAASTTLDLASAELDARRAAQLFNIGKVKAPKFVEAVRRCASTTDEAKDDARASANQGAASDGDSEAKHSAASAAPDEAMDAAANPCDEFLKRLKLQGQGYASILLHPRNWERWVYQGHAPRYIESAMEALAGRGSGGPVKRPRTHE